MKMATVFDFLMEAYAKTDGFMAIKPPPWGCRHLLARVKNDEPEEYDLGLAEGYQQACEELAEAFDIEMHDVAEEALIQIKEDNK